MAFLEQLANRQPGQPRQPEVPGAPPTASKPADKVNPSAAADGPVGRPSMPPPAFPGGAKRALPGVTQPAPSAATPSPSTSRPAPGTTSGGTAPAPPRSQLGLEDAMAPPLQHVMDRVPTMAELSEIAPGVEVVTPYGTMNRDGSLNLSPEGEAKYKQKVAEKRKKLGPHPFASDPSAPQLDIKLGRRMFNPFTGQWVEGD